MDSVAITGERIKKARFEELLGSYKKLLRTSTRLTRMSDRSEDRLKSAHKRILEQQEELENAHRKLAQHAEILEERVKERTKDLVAAQGKLEKLVELGIALSAERDIDHFVEMILNGAKELTNADGGVFYTLENDSQLRVTYLSFDSLDLSRGGSGDEKLAEGLINLRSEDGRPNYFNLISHVALTERTVHVTNVLDSSDFDFSDLQEFDKANGYRSQSLLAVPLKPRQEAVIGVLLLVNARAPVSNRITSFTDEFAGFVNALASQASVAMDNQNLIRAQEGLFDAIIQLIAGAIDAKSPYTGGHCARVPELGMMLTRAACEELDGPFADFDLNPAEWHEFRVAAWLHDCGKVTTPEYVVDKATKLETIYNRIHEIRTRFEVILRDYRIEYYEALQAGKGDPEKLARSLEKKISKLQDDYNFVAECNVGGEYMAPEKVERLKDISNITWERHFDDRIGLSQGEIERLTGIARKTLPVKEKLFADKKEHIVKRLKGQGKFDPKYQFTMKIPRHLYNYGELYNLSVTRGTLTDEERFKINEHMTQTIMMLEELPLPKNMARIPEYAGGHHETMVGGGYPRSLKKDDMSVPARVLAIADIFEALTAADRPYKKAKSISEAFAIMSRMRDGDHIDPDLFELFLKSGVYRDYAEKYLSPDQNENIEIVDYLN